MNSKRHYFAAPGCQLALTLLAAACVTYGQTPSRKAPPPAPAAAANLKQTVEQIARDYILEHPGILMESLRRFQENTKAAEAQKSRQMISARKAELRADSLTPAAGNPASDVTLTVFFDYRCGFCKKVTSELLPLTEANSRVRVVFKEFPILGPESKAASRAAMAAARQGAYLEFHKALMNSGGGALSADSLEEIARNLKLDVAKWKADMASPETEKAIQANHQLASAIGVQATPTFVAGDELIAGALDAKGFATLIDKAKSQPQTVAAAAR